MQVKTTLIGGPLDGLEIVIDQAACGQALSMPNVSIDNSAAADSTRVVVDANKRSIYSWDEDRFRFVFDHQEIVGKVGDAR